MAEGVKVSELLEEAAIDLIAVRLRTPLQIKMYLTLAFEQAFCLGAKSVTAEIVEQVLSRAIDDLEPTLTRNVCKHIGKESEHECHSIVR